MGPVCLPQSFLLVIAVNNKQGMKTMDTIELVHIGPDWADSEVKLEQRDGAGGGGGESVKGGSGSQDTRGGGGGEPSKSNGGGAVASYHCKPMSRVQSANSALVQRLVADTDGLLLTLDVALENVLFKSKRGKKPTPWKVLWELGPDIRISAAGYVRLRREAPKQWKRRLARGGEGEELKAETSYHRDSGAGEQVEPEDTVMGYRFGQERIVLTEEEENTANYDAGPKSLKLFGFVPRSELDISRLLGDGVQVCSCRGHEKHVG